MSCRVCGAETVSWYCKLESTPLLQNVLYASLGDARRDAGSPTEFWVCDRCRSLFNPRFEGRIYTRDYNNDQSYSSAYRSHLNAVVDILKSCSEPNDSVVEIGCGNGRLLAALAEVGYSKLTGYDPAHSGNLPCVRQAYWTPSGEKHRLLVLRHSLESMADFRSVLAGALRELTDDATAYFEFTNARYILEHGATITLYGEYGQCFSETGIVMLLSEYGFYCRSFHQFDDGRIFGAVAKRFRRIVPSRPNIGTLRRFENVHIWGISGRSINFLTQNDVGTDLVRHAVDIDPKKQGKFVPHTGQRILSPAECIADRPDALIVLNPRYVPEVAAQFAAPVTILTEQDLYSVS